MRTVALLLVVAAGLAGCLSPSPTPTPSTTPPSPTAAPSPTPPPSPPAASTPPPASGGPGGEAGGMLIRPDHEENASSGFTLTGDESASGFLPPGNVTFRFVATNQEDNATALFDPCGAGNPRVSLEDENGTTLDTAAPQVRCMIATSWQPMPSGGALYANLTWDGTVYHDGQPSQAPPGRYTAVATFEAKRGDAQVEVTVRVPVNLLDASQRGTL